MLWLNYAEQRRRVQAGDAEAGDIAALYCVDMGRAGDEVRATKALAHGIHLHTTGKCEGPAFTTAGGHLNPGGHQHGKDNPAGSHLGDLPNITIPASGKLETQIMVAGARQWDGEGGILDGDSASLIIHANPDDYVTDPSGNSGARIACAKIDLPERED